ncbi:hypothetical protein ILUMI_11966 [Ignelater luminosus]|uniref:Uncharacterized protein n=1 Tax=Ignelater luminosus TaxID=2038154 RepID=A0A8K0CZJ8_IGNLU|nr:hypothetical protein ILUMI_11966 [Ignelater luminosus]
MRREIKSKAWDVKKLKTEVKQEEYRKEINKIIRSQHEEEDIEKAWDNMKIAIEKALAEEAELEKYIKKCFDINYELIDVQIQKLAYKYAKALPHCEIAQKWHQAEQAKQGWKTGFMARRKTIL